MIEASQLAASSGDTVLRDLSFALRGGETLHAVDGSGAGARLLLDVLATARPYQSGHLLVDGLDPATNGAGIRGRIWRTGLIPRSSRTTVGDLVDLICRTRRVTKPVAERSEELRRVRLDPKQTLDRLAERDRAALDAAFTRLLMPRVVLADVPQDVELRDTWLDLVADLRRTGSTVVLALHAPGSAIPADVVLTFDRGHAAVTHRDRSPVMAATR